VIEGIDASSLVQTEAGLEYSGAQAVGQLAVVGSAIVSTIVSGSLSQIWGLINGLEVIIYLRLLSVDLPENA